jgi:hypothetical protein
MSVGLPVITHQKITFGNVSPQEVLTVAVLNTDVPATATAGDISFDTITFGDLAGSGSNLVLIGGAVANTLAGPNPPLLVRRPLLPSTAASYTTRSRLATELLMQLQSLPRLALMQASPTGQRQQPRFLETSARI